LVGGERRDLAFEVDNAVAVGFRPSLTWPRLPSL